MNEAPTEISRAPKAPIIVGTSHGATPLSQLTTTPSTAATMLPTGPTTSKASSPAMIIRVGTNTVCSNGGNSRFTNPATLPITHTIKMTGITLEVYWVCVMGMPRK